jgi:stage II sporulation protein D
VTIAPKEALTYGECKELIDKLIIKNPDFQSVYKALSFDFSKADEKMLIPAFLELYEAILSIIPEEERVLKEEVLLVLGREVTEDGRDRMVTDLGKYYYLNAESYVEYYEVLHTTDNSTDDGTEDASESDSEDLDKDVTENSSEDLAEDATEHSSEDLAGDATEHSSEDLAEDTTDNSTANNTVDDFNLIEYYMDKGIKALVCDQEIVYISTLATEEIIIHNVWIKKGEGTLVDTFVNGINKSFTTKFKLSSNVEKVVGDITIDDQKVVQISVKPDMIQGKVLRSGEDYIEIEGYGEVPLEENYKIYKIYEDLSMEPTGSILVGYNNTDFIVSGGKISAALITERIKAENIRVLIKTNSFKDVLHDKVEFTATEDFTVSSDAIESSYAAGDIVTIEQGDELFEGGRITIKTATEDAKIELLSIERSYGHPKYRGTVEISEEDNGLILVNELPLEEYLYAVIPSEMPTSYGNEALKVQAVCARSYAYKHLLANSLSEYGAHVDDSVSYQVYNNQAENEDSILAVKDTYGKVVEYDGEVITAYYFSTSCGHTTEASNVWANNVELPYLEGKLMLVEEEGEGSEAQNDAAELYEDLSSEDTFRSFMEAKDIITYDSGFNWYRWKATMSIKDIKKVIDKNLENRFNANPELILTMTSEAEEGKEAVFESLPVDTVGNIVDILVLNRDSSGIITELLITGSKKTIKVRKEYNIRALLAPSYDTLIRLDESEVEGLSLLPSAFFMIDKNEKDDKLSSITVSGGGYGHGVGMSQNGVKALADSGKNYEDILLYFYADTDMGFIYE